LDAPPGYFETASTTDVSLTSTRSQNTFFGGCPPSAVGNPPALRIEILLERGVAAFSFAEDAGPPRGHPASDGSVLDGTSPASGRGLSRQSLSLSALWRARQLYRLLGASPLETL
jgi:hypothetical protein